MAIEAPLSKFKKQNLLLFAGACLIGGIIFGYDGYLSKYEWSKRHNFYLDHIDENGNPDDTIIQNQWLLFILAGGAIGLSGYYVMLKDKKITVDDSTLKVNKQSISLDSIEKIDKTHFDKKGYFILTYAENGQTKELKLSDRAYDNMPAVLDHIVAKIS